MLELQKATKEDFIYIKRLYESAFPKEERLPFRILKKRSLNGCGPVYIAKEENVHIGFISLIECEDLVYLFYFAIEEKYRGQGYGSKVLKDVLSRFSDKKIFLARETLDKNADNYEQRLLRHEFYLKNGLVDLPYHIQEAKVVYDIMGNGSVITSSDYEKVMSAWAGKLATKLIPLRIIED